jgi:hypothetical protein
MHFEIHVTVKGTDNPEKFRNHCNQIGVKSILIHTEFHQQEFKPDDDFIKI